jgi:hypothetical protein
MPMADAMASKTMVFIGGLHRSGTSLLHQILRTHPQVTGFYGTGVPEDEGQHLQTVYKPAKIFGGPGKFGFDRGSGMDESHPLACESNARRLFEQWGRHWDLEKDYLLEKSPPNLVRTRFLQMLFPNTVFVILIRHPIAVAYATKKFSRWSPIGTLVEHWLVCHERLMADLPSLDRVHCLRYEDFVCHPQLAIDEICRIIGLERHAVTANIRVDVNEKYFRMWQDGRGGLRGLLWDTSWPKRLDERARRFGYSLTDPHASLTVELPTRNELRPVNALKRAS